MDGARMDAGEARAEGGRAMTATGRWRLLPFSDAPMGRQLALSEAMLAALPETGAPALRWYIPSARALVLGNGQLIEAANRAALGAQSTALYKRPSGGTAVLVDQTLLSLDITLPHSHPLATSDVVRAYEWIGEVWAAALRSLGVADARAIPTNAVRALAPLAKDDPLRLACYGTLSPYEVVSDVEPRKLVGLCQVRRRAGTLYQTGVYLRFDGAALASLLALAPAGRETLTARLGCAAIGLDEAAGRAITAQRVITAVQRKLRATHNARLSPSTWLPSELAVAEGLERERFRGLG
jgi:lipoate---protein ligase